MAVGVVAVGVALFVTVSSGTTEIPLTARFRVNIKQLVVPAVLAGRPVRFLVDTGASMSCLDRRFADELRLQAAGQSLASGIGGRHIPAPIVWLKGLRVGTLPPMLQVAAVLDLSWANADGDREAGTDVVGILGADFLFRTGGVIDFDRLTLRLNDPIKRDWRRLQGRWRSVSVVREGHTVGVTATLSVVGTHVVVTYDQTEGVRAYKGRLMLGQNSRPDRLVVTDLEHLDPPLKPRPVKLGPFEFIGRDDGLLSFEGLYELGPRQLVMVLPSDLRADRPGLPNRLISPVKGGLDLVTFERVGGPAAELSLTFRLAAWAAGHLRLGGWRLALTPDGTLTGVDVGRRLRFTARLDGTVLLAPER